MTHPLDAYYVVHDGYLYTYRPPTHRENGTMPDADIDEPAPVGDESSSTPTTDGESPTAATSDESPPTPSPDSGTERSDGAPSNE